MRRITPILLLCVIGAAGSGLLGYLHLQEHLRGRHAVVSWSSAAAVDDEDAIDEGACVLCMTLHAPLVTGGGVPAPVCLHLLLGLVALLAFPQAGRRAFDAIECRGPPMA